MFENTLYMYGDKQWGSNLMVNYSMDISQNIYNSGLGVNPFVSNGFAMPIIPPIFGGNTQWGGANIDYSSFINFGAQSPFQFTNPFLNFQFMPWGNDNSYGNHFNTKTNLPAFSNIKYDAAKGEKLASAGLKSALSLNTEHQCAKGVTMAMQDSGITKNRYLVGSAYNLAGRLDKHPGFEQISVARSDLKKLPAGCVIVWDSSPGHKDGHTAITSGDGKEFSSKVRNTIVRNNANYAVYAPVST